MIYEINKNIVLKPKKHKHLKESYVFAAPKEEFSSFGHKVVELLSDSGTGWYLISHSPLSYSKRSSHFGRRNGSGGLRFHRKYTSVGSSSGWIAGKSRECVLLFQQTGFLGCGIDRDVWWLSARPSSTWRQAIVSVSLVVFLENRIKILLFIDRKLKYLPEVESKNYTEPVN